VLIVPLSLTRRRVKILPLAHARIALAAQLR
jgi:hypothetical protein